MTEHILYKTHQHKIRLVLRVIRFFLTVSIPLMVVTYLVSSSIVISIIISLVSLVLSFLYSYFFWKKSYFTITNEKLSVNIRNGFFSSYIMSTHYSHIKDIAYSRNNFLHYLFDYGTLFVRTSAAGDGSFEIENIPKIEVVYEKVNYIYNIGANNRENLGSI